MMPRLRYLHDVDQVPELVGAARRIRNLHELLDDCSLEDQNYVRPVRPPRYVLVQHYADGDRRCGQAVVHADQIDELLIVATAAINTGWLPAEIHDLDSGERFPMDVRPVFSGTGRP